MAEVEQAIYDRLSNYAGLTALVSTRIYPMVLPQNPTYPAVRYQRISGTRLSAIDVDIGIAQPRFQVDCYAETYLGVKSLFTEVRGALQRWTGTHSGVVVLDSRMEGGDRDFYEDDPPGKPVYGVGSDWVIDHRE